jgi:thiol:disulfide interchange protein DsbD
VVFTGTDDLHYYAKSESAPAPGFNLKVRPSADGVTFGPPVFPKWKRFYDLGLEKDVEVYVGDFTVFIPLQNAPPRPVDVTVEITGLACTSELCLSPFTKTLTASLDPADFEAPQETNTETSPETSIEPPAAAIELARYEDEFSNAHLEPMRMDGKPGLAVMFNGTDDLHYYARSETAPTPQFNLRVDPSADGVTFRPPVFPKWKLFFDQGQEKEVEVYVGDFAIFVPFDDLPTQPVDVAVEITGLACTSQLCLTPFTQSLTTTIDPTGAANWRTLAFETQVASKALTKPSVAVTPGEGDKPTKSVATRQAVLPYSTGVYYLLAILAGISINLMPCVLPVIPLIMMRLIDQSKRPGGHRLASGLAFCIGVILFFAAFALVSAIINLTTGAVLDLNSLFRYPTAVIVLFLAIVFFGLAMLDVIVLSLPSSVTSKQGAGSGLLGTAGMGFFAGILSTPCSGALLGFVLVWAQTQTLLVSSTAIVLMGVGMALPYAIIVSIPSLLERIPKPGTWMEIFKKSTGFLLFLIAAKLTLAALPKDRLMNVLMYGIVFSFCVWMWGKWVGFTTPPAKRRLVRAIALVIAIGAGLWLLPAVEQPGEATIQWQGYDAEIIGSAAARRQPVVIKFTADWCTNCKVVDRKVYRDPEVVDLIEEKEVLAIKADTTLIDYPATVDLKGTYGEAGNVPVTIVLLPDATQQKLRGIFDKSELIDILTTLAEDK